MPLNDHKIQLIAAVSIVAISTVTTGCIASTVRKQPARSPHPLLTDENTLIGDKDTVILLRDMSEGAIGPILFEQNAKYADTNKNGLHDSGDAGFFNPASTVKVPIALAAIGKMRDKSLSLSSEYRIPEDGKWYEIGSDIRSMLAISDNDSTNRLILWIGFDGLRRRTAALGLSEVQVNRLMLAKGTLSKSPEFQIRDHGTVTIQPSVSASVKPYCLESNQTVGNCATADGLLRSMAQVVKKSNETSVHSGTLRNSDAPTYRWLADVLSKTPAKQGFKYPRNYCRFIDGAPAKREDRILRLLSKCGVALMSSTYSDLSYIETASGRRLLLLIAKQYPQPPNEDDVVRSFQATALSLLRQAR